MKVYNSVALNTFTLVYDHLQNFCIIQNVNFILIKQELLMTPFLPTPILLCFCEFMYLPHISGLRRHLSFCPWLPSLSIISSRFIHVVACSFSRLNNIPLYVYITFCLSMDTWVVSTFWPWWIMLLQRWVSNHHFKSLHLTLWDIHQRVELLVHTVIPFLICLRNCHTAFP